MILNQHQLQARAHEFALTNQLRSMRHQTREFWRVFRFDMDSLRSFADKLSHSRAECVQPAEDWLLDHIAFLETQFEDVLHKFTKPALAQIPRLDASSMPRVYAVCNDYLEHVDGRYDKPSFELYVKSYQEVSPLRVAECWALPIAMRAVIIRRLAAAMKEVRHRHEVCGSVAATIERVSDQGLSDGKIRAELDRQMRGRSLNPTEIVHFVRHLSEREPDIHYLWNWLSGHVDNSESSLENMVSLEHQLQAEAQVICGNLVQSLHHLERQPWRTTFIEICHVEQILLAEVNSRYASLDYESRDNLRSRLVHIAHRINVPEPLIANTVVRLAQSRQAESNEVNEPARDTCIAYYLLDPIGLKTLHIALSEIIRPRRLAQVAFRRRPMAVYLTSSTILLVCLTGLVAIVTAWAASPSPWAWLAVFGALILPVSEWSVSVVHVVIHSCCKPIPLLRCDFSKELPEDARTMVAIPVIWSSVEEVDAAVNKLLVHHFANRQANIHFGILADFADSDVETQTDDAQLLDRAIDQIEALRSAYGTDKFFLFHRSRRYNSMDNNYLGWERKRGKLVEFAELLSGSTNTSFTTVYGQTDILDEFRYVFTADLDTRLPMGVVGRMVGTMHFPYNRPRLNQAGTRVIEGFGVLQPRIAVSYESSEKSRFSELWAGEPGIDPYAFAVSNPYQDFFGQATFVGKGLFDVRVFNQTLAQRIPDNQVLSHDLLEGGILRAGLTSDIEVVEDHPSTLYAHQRRTHRWIRGDWQLIRWLGRTCRDRQGDNRRIDLCSLTRWQIVDNLRRSLLSPALLVVACLGVGVLPGRQWAWEAIVLLTLWLPFVRSVLYCVSGGGNWRLPGTAWLQSMVQVVLLPFSAVLAVDAVGRTLYRMFISRRNLLEWETAEHVAKHAPRRRVFVAESTVYLVIVVFALVTWAANGVVGYIVAGLSVLFGLLARPLASILNRPRRSVDRDWVHASRPALRSLAAEIWSFYDRYVRAEESWLPPDNVQYYPQETIAHRTSPTNMGLYLGAVIAAADLELIDTKTMLARLHASMQTIASLQKWHGHLYNWYDTQSAEPLTPRYVSTVDSGNFISYLLVVRQALVEWPTDNPQVRSSIAGLVTIIDAMVDATDFSALYNADDRLYCLGYHADTNHKETVLYDLLASEARQASFIGIALGQIPVSHWFTLARSMTLADGYKTLLSWSGTMFEYLMPSLIMRTYRRSVWASTYQGVIRRQQSYAYAHHIPFGISESGYYAFDYQMNYQYRAFGVPGLGFDRGLERNLVVAPYATILTLPYSGEAGLAALRALEQLGAHGTYGFYEAVDYTVWRLPSGRRNEVIQSFMAHHQGMSLLTLTNLLMDDVMVERFHRDARVRAADLLLQERLPVNASVIRNPIGRHLEPPNMEGRSEDTERTFAAPSDVTEANVLSNGRMSSVATTDGIGMLLWKGLAVTRWPADPLLDRAGVVVYLHDVTTEETWIVTHGLRDIQSEPGIVFRLDKTIYKRTYDELSATLEVTVSPDLDAEVRRLELVNHGREARTLEVTSFTELALASPSVDRAHPAFSKLFVETSHDRGSQCLLARRRPREENETPTWAAQTIFREGGDDGVDREYEFETDRAAFIGRGYTLDNPQALGSHLRGTVGSVADPAFVIRRTIRLEPGASVKVFIVTSVAETQQQAIDIVQGLLEPAQVTKTFHLAWVRSQIDIRHQQLTQKQASGAQVLAARLLFSAPLSRARQDAIAHNQLGQSGLWSYGVSGDVPIVTVRVSHLADLPFVALLARQHQYLHALGLETDLVIFNETSGGYQDELMNSLRERLAARGINQPQRIIHLKAGQLSTPEQVLLIASSSVLLRAGGPSLHAQLQPEQRDLLPVTTAPPDRQRALPHPVHLRPDREFNNGWGGFVDDGRAYQMDVQEGAYLPRPWTNVLANQQFGCILTELGTGYSWWRNSHECKLTPWTNDPVVDRPGECLYIRDLDVNDVWSAAPKPAGDGRAYRVTHGWGFSRIEQLDGDVTHVMDTTVPLDDPLKVIRLTIHNGSQETKRLAVTYYAEWVLGVKRSAQAPFIVTEWDDEDSILLANNVYQETFREAVGFLHITGEQRSWSGDRLSFIGRGGTLQSPRGVFTDHLSGRTGICADSCGAVQSIIEVAADSDVSVIVLLGCAGSRQEAQALVRAYNRPTAYEDALASISQHWRRITGQVQVKTPDRAMDVLLNGWLLYQTMGCRLWARSAFYQAGGAFGFRDQLQDSLALLHADSSVPRAQILHNAAHQYQEGDVQHWWHEETHKGIRTRFSDDLLWLPYAVCRYLEHTGDVDVLAESVPFLASERLQEGELERYEEATVSNEVAPLLEHCIRAIHHALKFGEHDIPLIGVGDWNDGMNRVGAKGRGESVWLGWFLLDILKRFTRLQDGAVPAPYQSEFKQVARRLERAQNEQAWDGAWFRRAFTDDGQWLGSITDKECRIDAIAQSWSVISGGTCADRQMRAMRSFDRELVDRELSLARLLTPAFNETIPSPGYIQGYPPGIRENGGQYTHGVIWSVIAWAILQREDKAHELFSLLTPILHTQTKREVLTFGNEPYVMSADVYTAAPHEGRAGWSWYTGAAGWMYQAGLEHVLGVTLRQQRLYIRPCVPQEWNAFTVEYHYGNTTYLIEVRRDDSAQGQTRWTVDGRTLDDKDYLELVDDGHIHQVTVAYHHDSVIGLTSHPQALDQV